MEGTSRLEEKAFVYAEMFLPGLATLLPSLKGITLVYKSRGKMLMFEGGEKTRQPPQHDHYQVIKLELLSPILRNYVGWE